MTTIIRVKRRWSEDPVEALVLSCKRKKTDNSDSDSFEKVLNFSGTVKEKDDDVATSTVESFHRESKYTTFNKYHTPDIRAKQRQEKRERREEDRFLLLSCLRSASGEGDPSAHPKESVTIVDVSKETNQQTEDNDAYVYDLYSVQNDNSDFDDLYMENLLSVHPLDSELEYCQEHDEGDEGDPDEEDSNDENHWRNDYPDSEPSLDEDEDESDDILARQLRKCGLGDSSVELSCDSRDEEFLNYDDEEQKYYYYEAEDLGGRRYAQYKANALQQMIHDDMYEMEDTCEVEDTCEMDGTSGSEDRFCDCEESCRHSD